MQVYGNASCMQVMVTADAISRVRRMIPVGYGACADLAEVVEVPGVADLPREGVGRPEAWISSATSAAT